MRIERLAPLLLLWMVTMVVEAAFFGPNSRCAGSRRWECGTMGMCICIHCRRVTNCNTYHMVETKHEQPHLSPTTTFQPRNPTIHVHIRTLRTAHDRRTEEEKMWRNATPPDAGTIPEEDGNSFWTPITTYEYDVVNCTDFVRDIGCWVRHMPEEIRRVNPHFVPS